MHKISDYKYSVDGTPTDSVFLGLHKLGGKKPRLVLSGINKGGNLGNDLTYSGTVAAAIEAHYNKIPAVAISLYFGKAECEVKDPFPKAADMFFSLILPFIEESFGGDVFYEKPNLINVNIPVSALDKEDLNIEWTTLGVRKYGGEIIERKDPRGKSYYWIGGDQHGFEDIKGSDCIAVKHGKVSLTPLEISLADNKTIKHLLKRSL